MRLASALHALTHPLASPTASVMTLILYRNLFLTDQGKPLNMRCDTARFRSAWRSDSGYQDFP